MRNKIRTAAVRGSLGLSVAIGLAACTSTGPGSAPPRLAAARPGPLLSCADLAAKAAVAGTA